MAVICYNGKNKILARNLRKNMTRQERHLWYDFLCDLPVRFRRQKQFGEYIVDFYCSSAKLVIELDGMQHFDEEGVKKDNVRDAYLESLGLRVMRIGNHEIDTDFDNVCTAILMEMGLPRDDRRPLPSGWRLPPSP